MEVKKIHNSLFLFWGLIAYTVIFYSQIGARLPFLATFRVEFALGSLMLVVIILKIIKGEIPLDENNINKAAIIFFIVCTISVPLASVKSRALEQLISLLKFFSIYLFIIASVNSEKKLKIFFYTYLAMISLLFVQPFFLSLKGEGFIYNNHMWRLAGVTGFFGHPNQLGGIASANLPFFYYLFLYNKTLISKLLSLLLILIAIYVIMLTQSRTAFVGVFFFGFFVWWSSNRKILIILVLLVFFIIGWNIAPQETKNRFLTLTKSLEVATANETTYAGNKELGSMNSRIILFKRSLTIFIENPILGVGIGCYPSVSGRRWNSWIPTHCLYTQILADLGLVGTISFGYVLFCMMNTLSRSKNLLIKQADRSLVYYIVRAVYMFLLIRFVIGIFGQDLYRNWWWVAAGLSVVSLRVIKLKYQDGEIS